MQSNEHAHATSHDPAGEPDSRYADLTSALLETAPVLVVIVTPEGRVDFANARFEAFSGWPLAEIRGADWFETFVPSHRREVARVRFQTVLSGEQLSTGAVDLVTRGGKKRTVEWSRSALRSPAGKVTGVVAFGLDVTERSWLEGELRREHQLLAEVGDAIVTTDLAGTVSDWNRGAEHLYGFTAEEMLGAPIRSLFPPGEWERFDANVLAPLVAKGRHLAEIELVHKSGRKLAVALRLGLVRGKGGSPTGMVAYATDVTERRQLESQLAEAKRMEAIGTLASGIAHDFNNILGSILGNAELLLRQTAGDGDGRHALEEVRQSAQRGAELVQQILTFSRQGREPRTVISLAPVVEEAARLSRSHLPAGVELQLEVEPDLPNVVANETQIHQVVVNLCRNACNAIGEREGQIDVHLGSVVLSSQPELHVELPPGRYAHLSVTDTGTGIDPAVRERIFEPFFTTGELGRGTGLGLSVVHGIVRSHGGAITVTSAPGDGTRFDLYFPATADPLPSLLRIREPELVGGAGGRILFVDDEPALASLAQRVLEHAGYEVDAHTDPQVAVGALRADPAAFDLLVVDFNMPGMSGLDLAELAHQLRSDLPIVLMSGYVTDELQAKGTLLGARRILQKPVSLAELTQTASEFCAAEAAVRLGERS